MTLGRLFDDVQLSVSSELEHREGRGTLPPKARRVRRSALWAAYGDALGWISELTDEKGLDIRTGGVRLQRPIDWIRRIGGRNGVTVKLPRGCYSDDSQLRLATSRSIRSDGFDIEAFSKVELPVWLSYALGGGKSTTAAARNLSKLNAQWYANRFKGWANSGGNGAAMRIQPHVWASREPGAPSTFITDVIRNSICTHSHPHGILGAMIHALGLAFAMVNGRPPQPKELIASVEHSSIYLTALLKDSEVGRIWLPTIEQESRWYGRAWDQAVEESKQAIQIAGAKRNSSGEQRYEEIVNELKLRNRDRLGSGLLTSIAAMGLTWSEPDPERAMTIAANALGTDTDTIATMAGATLGAIADYDPPVDVMDAELFLREADRMSAIAASKPTANFEYPDLLRWVAPKTQADYLVMSASGECRVRGLGIVEPQDAPIRSKISGFMWQWVKTEYGQSLLIKRREVLPVFPTDLGSTNEMPQTVRSDRDKVVVEPRHLSESGSRTDPDARVLPFVAAGSSGPSIGSISRQDFNKMIRFLEHHHYDDANIGAALRSVVNRCTPEQTLEFLAILAKRLREPVDSPSIDRKQG